MQSCIARIKTTVIDTLTPPIKKITEKGFVTWLSAQGRCERIPVSRDLFKLNLEKRIVLVVL